MKIKIQNSLLKHENIGAKLRNIHINMIKLIP